MLSPLRVAVFSAVLLLSGCVAESMPPAPRTPFEGCADPTRIAYSDWIPQDQMDEVRKVLAWLGAGEADLFPIRRDLPAIRNRQVVVAAMEQEYPQALRRGETVGTVETLLMIDERGRVAITLVMESSGHQALDEAAVRVARKTLFSPARWRGTQVCSWHPMPINFTNR